MLKYPEEPRPLLYIVQENVLSNYAKPCQLDMKLGFSTVEPQSLGVSASKMRKWTKYVKLSAIDKLTPSATDGARLAGLKVYNPFDDVDEKITGKGTGGLTSLPTIFDKYFDSSGHAGDTATMQKFRERLLQMSSWWAGEGVRSLRAIAMSALMVYECKPFSHGVVSVSDVSMNGKLPPRNASERRREPYIEIRSLPTDKLFPKLDGSFSKSTFISKTLSATFTPNWSGKQFEMDYGYGLRELVLDIIDSNNGKRELIGTAHIDLTDIPIDSDHRACVKLTSCKKCPPGSRFQIPKVCASVRRSETTGESTPRPRIKLIDFAHLFTTQDKYASGWAEDGVTEGMLSAVRELDRKIGIGTLAGPKVADGKNMKCSKGSRKVILSADSCKQFAAGFGKKFGAWRATTPPLGECRVCDKLTKRNKRWFTSGPEYTIFEPQ